MRQGADLGHQRLVRRLVDAHQGNGVVAGRDTAKVEGGDIDSLFAQQMAQSADEAGKPADELRRMAETLAKVAVHDMPEGDERRKAYAEAVKDAWDTICKLPGLSGKVQTLKALADVYKTLIPLKRQAFGMDEIETPEGTVLRALRELHGIA